MRIGAAVELAQVRVEMGAPVLGGREHRVQAVALLAQRGDLALDAVARLDDEHAPLVGVGRGPEALAIALAGGLVLEQLADLGQAEPGVVAELLDEAQALQVGRVEEAVRAVAASGRLEQADLLVVADGPGRQAGLGRDLLDPEELGGRRSVYRNVDVDVKVRPATESRRPPTLDVRRKGDVRWRGSIVGGCPPSVVRQAKAYRSSSPAHGLPSP